ncbi:MAG: OB-fold nucleic acid binding domain-containing protein [Candidatus Asgardarchaeia archaeon]
MEQKKKIKKRNPAVPMTAQQIISYFKNIKSKQYNLIARVRFIGTVVNKSSFIDSEDKKPFSFIDVEDLTGVIRVKAWDFVAYKVTRDIDIGDIVLVIGRVKVSDDFLFITAELLKKLDDPIWELYNFLESNYGLNKSTKSANLNQNDVNLGDVMEKILNIIRKHDLSSPVSLGLIKEKLHGIKTELILKAINSLIENGEIYEVSENEYKIVEG